MSFETHDYLRHILAEAEYLIQHSQGLSLAEFEADATLQRAFVRSLEIIGEAVKKLPADFVSQHPDIEWRLIARMRDRLIHGYFAVDHGLVWEVVQTKIPALREAVRQVLASATD